MQRGAAALEFALMFLPLFALFYAIVSYGLIMALQQGMTLAAEEGARAAVAVDPSAFATTAQYIENGVTPQVRRQVGQSLAWLPDTIGAHVLGSGNDNVGVVWAMDGSDVLLTVQVRYADYSTTPLIPTLMLPGIGAVPRVPGQLSAEATVRL